MAYEIDFLGVDEDSKDADAIALRWREGDSFIIGVVDGGFSQHGEAMVEHLNNYYFNGVEEEDEKIIDFVVCTHPHQDHASGLKVILENFHVNALYMNRPWEHIDDLYDRIADKRITKNSLKERLKDTYTYVADLEKIALEKGMPVYDVFEGDEIEGRINVLSPDKDFYLDMITEDDNTPLIEDGRSAVIEAAYSLFEKAKKAVRWITETWDSENLREDVDTDPINETSVVLLGHMDEEKFLLTGDAGLRGLNNAIDYAESLGVGIDTDVSIYQIPHHGGRHNVSTLLLDRMIGKTVERGVERDKAAYVMAGKESDHPKKIVTNAYKRRGVSIFEAKGKTICHHAGDMPERIGWSAAKETDFSDVVEDWDE